MRLHFLNCLVLVIVMIVAQTRGEIFPKRSINEPNFPESVDAFFDNGSEEDLEDNFSNLRYLPSLEKPDLDKRSTEFNSMKLLKRSKLRNNAILNFESNKPKSSQLLRKNKRHLVGDNTKLVNYLKELEQLLPRKRNAGRNPKIRKKKDCVPIPNECIKPTEFKIKKQRKPVLNILPFDSPVMTINKPFSTECHTTKPTKATPPTTIPPATTPTTTHWPKITTIKTTPCPPETLSTTEYSTKFTTVHSTTLLEEITNEAVIKMETTTELRSNVIWPESLDKTIVESERQIRELELQKVALKRKFHQEKRFIDENQLEKKGRELKVKMNDIYSFQNRLEMQDTNIKNAEADLQKTILESMYGKSTIEKPHQVFHFNQFEPTESQPMKPSSTERQQPFKPSSKPVAQHHQNKGEEQLPLDNTKETKSIINHLSSTDSSNDDIELMSQDLDSTDLIDTNIFQALHNLDTHLSKKTTTAPNTYSKKKHRGKRKATFSDLPVHHFAVAPIDISSNENFNDNTDSLNRNFLKFPVKKLYKKSTNKAKDKFHMRPENKLKIYEFRKKNAVQHKRKIPENILSSFHEESKDDEDPTTNIFEENEVLESSESAKSANGGINTEILTKATEVNNESITLSPIYVNLPTNPTNVSTDDGSIEHYYLQQLYPTSNEAHIVVSTDTATEEPESLSPDCDEADTTVRRAITTENYDNINKITQNVILHTNNKPQMAKHSNKNVIHKHVSGSAEKKSSDFQNHSPEHQNESENMFDDEDSIIKEDSKHEIEEQTKTELTEHETDEQTEGSEQETEESKEEHETEENVEYKQQDNLEHETEEQLEHKTEESERGTIIEEAKSVLETIKQKLAKVNQQEANEDVEHLFAELKKQFETYDHHHLTTIQEDKNVESTEETEHETKETSEHATIELDKEENTEEHVTKVEYKTKENNEYGTDEYEEQETEENEDETEEYTTECAAEEYTKHETEETTSYTEQNELTTLMENSNNIVEHNTEILSQVQVENQIIAAEEISNKINQDHEFEIPQSEYDYSKDSEQKDDDEDECNQQTEETESQVLAIPVLDSSNGDQNSETTSESQREPNPPIIEYNELKERHQYVDEKPAHQTKVLYSKYHPHQEEKEYNHKQLIEDAQHQTAEYLHEDRNDESKELEDNETELFKSNIEDGTTEKSECIIKKTKHKNKHSTTEEAEWLIKEIKHEINTFEKHMKQKHHDESEHKIKETEDETNEPKSEENTEEHVEQTATEEYTEPETETHTEHETEEHTHETIEEAKVLLEEIKGKLAETDQQESDENAQHILEEIKEKLEEHAHHLTTTVEADHETAEEVNTLLKEIKGKLAETDQQESDENAQHILEEIKEKLEEYDHHLTTTVEVAHETAEEANTLLEDIKGKLAETDQQESDENAQHILEEIKEKLEDHDHHLTTTVEVAHETAEEVNTLLKEIKGKLAETDQQESDENAQHILEEIKEKLEEHDHHLTTTVEVAHETAEEANTLLEDIKGKLAETDQQESDENAQHILEEIKEKLEEHDHHSTTTVEVAHETAEEANTLLEDIKGKLAETDQQESDENAQHILEEIKEKLEEHDHHSTTTVEVAHETAEEANTLLEDIKGKLAETDQQESDENAQHILEEIKEKLEEYDHHSTTAEVEVNSEDHEHETTEDVDHLIKEALETIVEYQHHLHLTTTETTAYEHETEVHNHETAEKAEQGVDESELHNNDSITTEHKIKEVEDEELSKIIEHVYGINETEEVTHENEDLNRTSNENLPEVQTQEIKHVSEESTHETDETTLENNEQNVPKTTVEADLMLEHIEQELEGYIAHKNKTQKSSENQATPNKEDTSEEHPTVTTEETNPFTFAEKSTTKEITESTTEEQVMHEETIATTEEIIKEETTEVTTKETTITTTKEQLITSKENTEPIEKLTEEVPEFTIYTVSEKSTSESIKTTVKEETDKGATDTYQTSEDLYNELAITNKAIELSNNCNLEDYEAKDHCICSIKHVLQDLFDDINKINSTENYYYTCKNFIHIDPGIIISNKSESKILRKRKTGDFIQTYVWKREARVGRAIDDFLREDLTIPNGNVTYVNVGSKVVIPCTDDLNQTDLKENINYLWTIGNGSPETTGDRPNNGSSLVISSVSSQDSDKYTCTTENRNSHQVTSHVHQLSVVSLPSYNLVVTVHLNASSTCEPGDMEVLNLYYPVAIKDLLCSGEAERVCNIVVEKPQCIRLGSEDIISLHATLSTEPLLKILPRLNTKTCNLSCQSRLYSIFVSILLKNFASVTNLPVFFRLSYRQAELTPIQYQKGDITNMVSNSIMTICPPGFGIYDNQKLCLACKAYTFNPGNQMTCTPCPKGSYQPAVGSRMCLPCKSPLDDSSCFLPGAIARISRKYFLIPIVTLMAILLVIGFCCCFQRKTFKERMEKIKDKYSTDTVQIVFPENLAKKKSSKSLKNRHVSLKNEDRSKSNTKIKDKTKSKNELYKNKSSTSKLRQKSNISDSEVIEIVVTNPNPGNKTPPEPPPIDFQYGNNS